MRPAPELMWSKRPLPFRRMYGRTARFMRTTPKSNKSWRAPRHDSSRFLSGPRRPYRKLRQQDFLYGESIINDAMLQLIGGPYGLCSAFANDHARSHRIARRHARHD